MYGTNETSETTTTNPSNDQQTQRQRLIKRTVIDSYLKSSFCEKAPEYSFGTGSRPPLYQLEGGPGKDSGLLRRCLLYFEASVAITPLIPLK